MSAPVKYQIFVCVVESRRDDYVQLFSMTYSVMYIYWYINFLHTHKLILKSLLVRTKIEK